MSYFSKYDWCNLTETRSRCVSVDMWVVCRDVTSAGSGCDSLRSLVPCVRTYTIPFLSSSCILRVQATHYACVSVTQALPIFAPETLVYASGQNVLQCTKVIWNSYLVIIYGNKSLQACIYFRLAVPGHALLWLRLVKWKRKKRESARF
jgi:hypothetical protein